MTPQRARELLEVFTAFANGETIQCRSRLIPEWGDLPDAGWRDDHEYRIKPKPRLRPWKPEEMPKVLVVRQKAAASKSLSLIVDSKWEHGIIASRSHLAEDYVLVDMNGNEHPCGVICGEGE